MEFINGEFYRKRASLAKYGDTRSARASILREIKKAIDANPVFLGKNRVLALDSLRMSNLHM